MGVMFLLKIVFLALITIGFVVYMLTSTNSKKNYDN